jgi:hypothetical protein
VQKLCAELVLAKPENPRAFLAQLLANMQVKLFSWAMLGC